MGPIKHIEEGASTVLPGDVCGWACGVVWASGEESVGREVCAILWETRWGGGSWGGISSWLKIYDAPPHC